MPRKGLYGHGSGRNHAAGFVVFWILAGFFVGVLSKGQYKKE